MSQGLLSISKNGDSTNPSAAAAATTPTIQEIVSCTNLIQACLWCKDEGIILDDESASLSDAKIALLELRRNLLNLTTLPPPPIAVALSVLQAFASTKDDFLQLVHEIETFTYSDDAYPWFENLQLTQNSESWLTKEHFEEVRNECSVKPMLLIAGSTSAGKTTLLNALLGESILPTRHNATTFTICEVKYGEIATAVAHYRVGNGKEIQKPFDLTTRDNKLKFYKMLSKAKVDHDQLKVTATDETETGRSIDCNGQLRRLEILWPMEFLKKITLVDSPGVTEDDAETFTAKDITEKYQENVACGYIYVLDGGRAAEEAAQVGSLLKALEKSPCKKFIVRDSAIFVVNKWDLVKTNDRKQTLRILNEQLKARWPGFKSYQLLTINSRLAEVCRNCTGESTPDLVAVCEAITKMLPGSLNNIIAKSIRRPCDFMISTETVLKSILRQLKLPVEERKKLETESWADLHKVETLLKMMEAEVNTKIFDLKMSFVSHLESQVVRESFCKLNTSSLSVEEKAVFDAGDVTQFVEIGLCRIAENFLDTNELQEWANTKLKKDVTEARKLLNTTSLRIHGSNACNRSVVPSVEKTMHAFSKFGIMMRAGAVAAVIAGALMRRFAVRTAAAVTTVGGASVLGTIAAFPVGLAIAAVGAMAIIAGKIQWDRKKVEAFQKLVKEVYEMTIIMNKDNHSTYVHNLISTLAQFRCTFLEDVLDILPQKWRDLHKDLIAVEKAQDQNRPHYQNLLSKWQNLHGKLSMMRFQCNGHEFTSNDVSWPQSKPPVGTGSFGVVYKVAISEVGESALKVMRDNITQQTACDLRKEINISRQCQHENIVTFYGSVQLSSNPLKIGLLYEWCGRGTLASFIGDDKEQPAYTAIGFSIAQSFALDMLSGIGYLHDNDIIHRDMKPENVLITNQKKVRLADMGLAKPIQQVKGTACGTLSYMAPEVFREKPCTVKADMFSFGIIMWELWNKQRAHQVTTIPWLQFFERVENGDLRPGDGIFFGEKIPDRQGESVSISGRYPQLLQTNVISQFESKMWADVARSCWSSDPDKRPSANAAHKAIANIVVKQSSVC